MKIIRIKTVWRAFCKAIFLRLFKLSFQKVLNVTVENAQHTELLRHRLVKKRHELAILKTQIRAYKRLRIHAKAAFSHGENVKYIDRTTVKLKLPKKFHDDILQIIASIESKEIPPTS